MHSEHYRNTACCDRLVIHSCCIYTLQIIQIHSQNVVIRFEKLFG